MQQLELFILTACHLFSLMAILRWVCCVIAFPCENQADSYIFMKKNKTMTYKPNMFIVKSLWLGQWCAKLPPAICVSVQSLFLFLNFEILDVICGRLQYRRWPAGVTVRPEALLKGNVWTPQGPLRLSVTSYRNPENPASCWSRLPSSSSLEQPEVGTNWCQRRSVVPFSQVISLSGHLWNRVYRL